MNPNDIQIGGDHYMRRGTLQHWDMVYALRLDYFRAVALKYLDRYDVKGGVEDLRKAIHFLQKYNTIYYYGTSYNEDQWKIVTMWVEQYDNLDRKYAVQHIIGKNIDEAIEHIENLIATEPGATYVNPNTP